MVKILAAALVAAVLAGCQTTVATYQPYPVYGRPMNMYDGPVIYRRTLVVPHRNWYEQHCWPVRVYSAARGGWVDDRRCAYQ